MLITRQKHPAFMLARVLVDVAHCNFSLIASGVCTIISPKMILLLWLTVKNHNYCPNFSTDRVRVNPFGQQISYKNAPIGLKQYSGLTLRKVRCLL
jgi:hypothetical protein